MRIYLLLACLAITLGGCDNRPVDSILTYSEQPSCAAGRYMEAISDQRKEQGVCVCMEHNGMYAWFRYATWDLCQWGKL